MRNVWNTAINIGTFTLKNTETNQVLALDSVVLDSGQRVIVAFGNGSLAAEAQFILANNYPDQNLSEDGLHWQWQTDLILGDDAARLQLFENNIQRDELRYGDDIGKLAENDSSQDSVYVLRRQGYEEGQNASDYPEYSRQSQRWEETDEVAIIYGGYALRPVNLKRYELKDHLGNVRVIVSDVKDATLGAQGGATAFAAIIEHYSHYYPFGMEKPSMVFDKGAYRYGFNGKENDDEIAGVANSVDFGARVYDSRAARWLSLDPLAAKYPSMSAYNYTLNNPISFKDVDGRDVGVTIVRNANGKGGSIQFSAINFVKGDNATALVTQYNAAFAAISSTMNGNYTDNNGNVWSVSINMVFAVADATTIGVLQGTAFEESAVNMLDVTLADDANGNPGRGHAGGQTGAKYSVRDYALTNIGGALYYAGKAGNLAKMSPRDASANVAIHEILHLFGLGDRYSDVSYLRTIPDTYECSMIKNAYDGRQPVKAVPHIGFENDWMGNTRQPLANITFAQTHFDNMANTALYVSGEKKTDNFVMGRKVDLSHYLEADKVIQSYTENSPGPCDATYSNPVCPSK